VGCDPVSVEAHGLAADTVVATLGYENGSVGSLTYASNGDSSMPKERVEVFGGGRSAILEDWKTLTLYSGGKSKTTKGRQEKGFREELTAFVTAVEEGGASPIPLAESVATTRATFAIMHALRE